MYTIEFESLMKFVNTYNRKFDDFKPVPIDCLGYVKRVLNEEFKAIAPKYPMDILLPPSTQEMLKGNLKPAQVIHLEEPVIWEDTPIWFGDSRKEVFLRFGYENLDARFISRVPLGSKVLHGFLAGATGQGKSVAINALMCALFMEYGPWELNVHLSDAKILEFKKYGVNHRIPHIKTIAATEDADFVISVMENAVAEMKDRQALFGNLGTANIKDFRKKTGLALPRLLILMDEVETTFQIAGKKSARIAEAINAYTKLGRATGVNLIMATQNYSSDIPSGAMNQISLRMCLGATESVSEKILGNKGAAENLGRIGRMIVNTETLTGGDTTKFNTKYQLPFLSDEDFEIEMELLERKGREVGYPAKMSFYDETDIKDLDKMISIINDTKQRFKANNGIDPIYLGYPAFVSEDEEGLLKVDITFEDAENILIVSPIALNLAILLSLIYHNLADSYLFVNISARDAYLQIFGDSPLNKLARSVEANEFQLISYTVNTRLGMDLLDSVASKVSDEEARKYQEKFFATMNEDTKENMVMLKRYVVYTSIDSYKNFGKLAGELKKWFPSFHLLAAKYKQYNAENNWITKDNFKKTIITLGDLNKILGLGRDSKSREIEALKQMMQDAYRVNILFVLYTSTMSDLQSLITACRYAITDSVDYKEFGRMKIEDPGQIKDMLCVLYDYVAPKESLRFRKFKRSV